MAREQLGAAPSIAAHATTKTYVDTQVATKQDLVNSASAVSVLSPDAGGSINLGRNNNVSSSPYIDFNSASTTSDYDARIQCTGGTGVAGRGTLKFSAGQHQFADTNGSVNVYIGNSPSLDVYGVGNNHAAHFNTPDTVTGSHAAWFQRTGSTGSLIGLYYSASVTLVGNITTNGSTTTYGTTSDYRLKENVVPLSSGLGTIAALNPVSYKWKETGLYGEGFLAHELQDVIPEAVVGEKDAEIDGWIVPQTVDLAKVVPHLVTAVQELTARLEAAEARIAQLEGNTNG